MSLQKKLNQPEKSIEKEILEWLKWQNDVVAWKNNSVGIYDPNLKKFRRKSRFDINGVSDIIGVWTHYSGIGVGFFIEVKSDKGKLSENQKRFLALISKAGAIAFVARSVVDVQFKLDQLRKLDIQNLIKTLEK